MLGKVVVVYQKNHILYFVMIYILKTKKVSLILHNLNFLFFVVLGVAMLILHISLIKVTSMACDLGSMKIMRVQGLWYTAGSDQTSYYHHGTENREPLGRLVIT